MERALPHYPCLYLQGGAGGGEEEEGGHGEGEGGDGEGEDGAEDEAQPAADPVQESRGRLVLRHPQLHPRTSLLHIGVVLSRLHCWRTSEEH